MGSGIDVIEVGRIERALARFGERFERRVFHEREIRACRSQRAPALQYARRFAAKEALMKAVGTGWARGVRWIDIETVEDRPGGRLELVLHGAAAVWMARRGASRAHLDASGGPRLALALVLLEDPGT